MIAVLGGLADVERDLIRTRTAEGRSRAQKRGQRMGPEINRSAAGRGPQAAGRRCHACRTGAQLPRGKEYNFEADGMKPRFLRAFKSARSGTAKRFGASCNNSSFSIDPLSGRST
jgi:hypothetical protein